VRAESLCHTTDASANSLLHPNQCGDSELQACVTHFFARLPWVPLMTMVALRSVLGQ
jgi:hypothetical protein